MSLSPPFSQLGHFLVGLTWTGLVASFPACTLDEVGHGEPFSTCGNDFVDEGEGCDGDLFADKTCLDFGFTHGRLACDSSCHVDSSGCHTCGNGVREGDEDCDGADLDGQTCKSAIGFSSGTLGCTSQCRWDPNDCSTCGNAIIEAGEACDEFVASEHTCKTEVGHESGKLFCSPSCAIDTTQCFTCGDGAIDGPEKCDGQALGGMDCIERGHDAGTLLCNDDCSFDESQCLDLPADWYDTAWLYRRQIVVGKALVDADLSDFPMLVSLKDPEVAQHAVSSDDFVFTDADGVTVLPYEIETYDNSTGHLLAWVKAPHLISTIDTKLFVYYGNQAPPPPPDSGEVWSDGYTAVWHLNDVATDESSGALHVDAATGQHPGNQFGNHDVEGRIGRAQSFDGLDDYVEIVGPDGIVLGDADCTVSAWVRTTSTASISLLRKAQDLSHVDGDKLFGLTAGKFAMDQSGAGYMETTATVNDGEWHYVVWTQRKDANAAAEAWAMYVDGVPDGTAEHETKADVAGHALRVGGPTTASAFPVAWDGEIDELRVSHVTRGAAWVSTSYLNQYAPETFLTLGPVETILTGP